MAEPPAVERDDMSSRVVFKRGFLCCALLAICIFHRTRVLPASAPLRAPNGEVRQRPD